MPQNYLNRNSPNTLITGREGTSVSDYLRRKREAELMPQERGALAQTDEYGRINIGGDIGWRDVIGSAPEWAAGMAEDVMPVAGDVRSVTHHIPNQYEAYLNAQTPIQKALRAFDMGVEGGTTALSLVPGVKMAAAALPGILALMARKTDDVIGLARGPLRKMEGAIGQVYRGRTVPLDAPNPSGVAWTTPSQKYAGFYTTGQGKTPFDYTDADVLSANITQEGKEAAEKALGPLYEQATNANEAYRAALAKGRLQHKFDVDPREAEQWFEAMGVDMPADVRQEMNQLQELSDNARKLTNDYHNKSMELGAMRDQGGYIEPLQIEYNKPYIAKDESEVFTESDEWFQSLRDQGYDSIVWSPNDDLTGLNVDEIQEALSQSKNRPYGAEVVALYPDKQLKSSIVGQAASVADKADGPAQSADSLPMGAVKK